MNRVETYKILKQELGTEIHAKLQSIMSKMIPGSDVTVLVSEDLEVFTFTVLLENQISQTTVSITENVFVYNLNDPDNIVFKGATKVGVYKPREDYSYPRTDLYSLSVTNAEIDLRTLFSIRNRLHKFVEEEGLLNTPIITSEEDPFVHLENNDIKEIVDKEVEGDDAGV